MQVFEKMISSAKRAMWHVLHHSEPDKLAVPRLRSGRVAPLQNRLPDALTYVTWAPN